MPSRREVLAGAGLLAASTLAGCAQISGPQYLHFVGVSNLSEQPHAVRFDIYDSADERLYSYSNTFPPDYAEEYHVFDGTPARIVVEMDARDAVERSWNTDVCSGKSPRRSGLRLSIHDEPDPPHPETLHFVWDCQSISRDSGFQTYSSPETGE